MKIEAAGEFSPPWRNDAFWLGTRAPLEASTGLDPAAYTDVSFFDDEQMLVFERAWVCVGIAADSTPGRVLVRSIGRRSILITRNANGELRGFVNSCRHRGTELYEGDCDISSTLRCPYHRWGYTLDGDLKSAPHVNDVPRDEFDQGDYSLASVRVEAWGVLLFACLDETTPPLHEWLGDLPARMAGYEMDDWQPRLTQELDIEANWKLISENFQEYYHLTWVHPELAKVSRVDDHYRYQGAGMYCGQTTTPVSGDERDDWLSLPPADGLDESDAVSGRFVAIFPNVLLSVLPNHVFVMRLDPVAPGLTRETCTWLLPKSGADASSEAFDPTRTFWLDVNNEDIDIVQRGQRGLTHGHVPAGPLIPRFEEPLHRFQRMLADLMTRPNMADVAIPPGDDGSEPSRLGTAQNPNPATIDR
jgi:phenylpropionate dioxygenase-like ring-hydroxylating dioxygenase large terminal subunit